MDLNIQTYQLLFSILPELAMFDNSQFQSVSGGGGTPVLSWWEEDTPVFCWPGGTPVLSSMGGGYPRTGVPHLGLLYPLPGTGVPQVRDLGSVTGVPPERNLRPFTGIPAKKGHGTSGSIMEW